MANLKISNLPISTNLEGLEPIVVVQDGVTKQSTVQNILNYMTPTSLVVSAGQVISLQDALYDTAQLIRMTWSGANGTMTLNLPTASLNVNRVMRFISNGGFATATKVNLKPTGTELLDGVNTHYVINKSYEGIQVWSDGVEWFIIQKKG
tara:strand:+ start:92 stop:541 length:450 start_codon:yes stop_codon:yes gene_type:complete